MNRLWTIETDAYAEYASADWLITAPSSCWRGGHWTRYNIHNGETSWRRWHRRGSRIFAVIDEVIIATTYTSSGIYALSMETGRRLWTRLGPWYFEPILRVTDWLPANNVAMGAQVVLNDHIVTSSGLVLCPKTGRTVDTMRIEYEIRETGKNTYDATMKLNGAETPFLMPPWLTHAGNAESNPQLRARVDEYLDREEMELAACGLRREAFLCDRSRDLAAIVVVAKADQPSSEPADLREHWLIALRCCDARPLVQEPLGRHAGADLDWLTDGHIVVRTRDPVASSISPHPFYKSDVLVYSLPNDGR